LAGRVDPAPQLEAVRPILLQRSSSTIIDTPDFKLNVINAVRRVEAAGGPYGDWIHLSLEIIARPFSGTLNWAALFNEFLSFKEQLEKLNKDLNPGDTAKLEGVEPGVQIELVLEKTGEVRGSYSVSTHYTDFDGPLLTGKFEMDQSYLPRIISAIGDLLSITPDTGSA